jgi:hypothetical protein
MKKIIKITDKIIATIFLLLMTLAAMLQADKPFWITASINWFVFTYLITKYVFLEKGIVKTEIKSTYQKIIYIIDRLFCYEQLGWWLIALAGIRGEEFTYIFFVLILEIYLFGKYILLKK